MFACRALEIWSDMIEICVITTSRADYGLLYYLLKGLKAHPAFNLRLITGGMHLREEFGMTVREIISDGFEVAGRVDMILPDSDSALGTSLAIGKGVYGFAQEYGRLKPDLVIVFGDRYEMFSAACASVPFNIPMAHIGGGESTAGSVDDIYRYAITSMSKYHFVSMSSYRQELVKRGVDGNRIKVVGYPAIENLRKEIPLSCADLEKSMGMKLDEKYLLVTVHPETSGEYDNTGNTREILSALDDLKIMTIFTAANADAGGREINGLVEEYCFRRDNAFFFRNLGRKLYLNVLRGASVVVGNSSSAIVETAFWGVPSVNLGRRQEGRIRGRNVIDVQFNSEMIKKALKDIIEGRTAELRENDRLLFGDGNTSAKIISAIENIFFGAGKIAL